MIIISRIIHIKVGRQLNTSNNFKDQRRLLKVVFLLSSFVGQPVYESYFFEFIFLKTAEIFSYVTSVWKIYQCTGLHPDLVLVAACIMKVQFTDFASHSLKQNKFISRHAPSPLKRTWNQIMQCNDSPTKGQTIQGQTTKGQTTKG